MKKYFGVTLLLVSVLFLTACFGGEEKKEAEPGTAEVTTEKGLKCTTKKVDAIGTSETQVVLDYNDSATTVVKYTKVDSIDFSNDYSAFVDVTKEQWEAACEVNMEEFDSCVVSVEGNKVIMTGMTEIKSDRQEEINENVFANTARDEAKTNYTNAGYTCE